MVIDQKFKKFKDKYPGIDDDGKFKLDWGEELGRRSIRISDELKLVVNAIPRSEMGNNYYYDIHVYDNDNGKKKDIIEDKENGIYYEEEKHWIEFSVEWDWRGLTDVPSKYRLKPVVIDHESKNFPVICIYQACDHMTVSFNALGWLQEQINTDEIKGDKRVNFIINMLLDFLKKFDALENDKNIQEGIKTVLPSLRKSIENVQKIWENFDIDESIKYYEELLERTPESEKYIREKITNILKSLAVAKRYQSDQDKKRSNRK